jgi:hypothetical protein
VLDLNQKVQLFADNGKLVGTYDTLQAAVTRLRTITPSG